MTFFYQSLSHKIYRKLIKKLRRQFLRQKLAKERDEQIIQKQNDPLYQAWVIHQENLRLQRKIEEEQEMYWESFFFCIGLIMI